MTSIIDDSLKKQNMIQCSINWLLAIAVTTLLLPNARTQATSPVNRESVDLPNVLMIVTDEHNFRTLGCYRKSMPLEQGEMWGRGNIVRTPNIDRIAAQGVICTRAYATTPVCTPCRAAMFTGRYPHTTGAPSNNLILDRSIPTIADRLNKAGYRSGYFGKWHLGGKGKPEWSPKVDGGFEFKKFMFNRGHWKKFVIDKEGQPAVGARKDGKPSYGVKSADETSFATDWLTDRAIEFTTDEKQTKPFFAVVSYPDPHGPNTVRAPYHDRFDGLSFQAPRTFQVPGNHPTPGWLGKSRKHDEFRGPDMSKYFGMVQCLDDNVGRLMQKLEETKQLDNTLVIFTSDHGDLCYEHDRINKGNPYEGSARVPMLLRFPDRIAKNSLYPHAIGTVDLTPTIVGFLGLPADSDDQGRDMSAELKDASEIPNVLNSERITFLRATSQKPNWIAAIDARYKLILSAGDEPWLFDAKNDPDEMENSCKDPECKAAVLRLAKSLKRYAEQCKEPALENSNIARSLEELLAAKSEAK